MVFAVVETRNAERRLFAQLFRLFAHRIELFAQILVIDDFGLNLFGRLSVFVKKIDDRRFDFLNNPCFDVGVAQLVLGLTFENRIFDLDRHRADNALTHIDARISFFVEFIEAFEKPLFVGAFVGAAVGCILPVDERIKCFAVVERVGKDKFDFIAPVVERRIHLFVAQIFLQQIEQAVFGNVFGAVVIELQPGVEIGVVFDPFFDEFVVEIVPAENLFVGFEFDESAVGFGRAFNLPLFQQLPFGKDRFRRLAAADGHRPEMRRQRIDRLCTDTVEADRKLKHIVVVFGPGVDDRNTFDQLAQRNAAPEIAHLNPLPVAADNNPPAVTHNKLVDAVVDHLFQQHINPVVRIFSAAQTPDVHPRPQPDVFQRTQCLNFALVIDGLFFFSHCDLPVISLQGNRNPSLRK